MSTNKHIWQTQTNWEHVVWNRELEFRVVVVVRRPKLKPIRNWLQYKKNGFNQVIGYNKILISFKDNPQHFLEYTALQYEMRRECYPMQKNERWWRLEPMISGLLGWPINCQTTLLTNVCSVQTWYRSQFCNRLPFQRSTTTLTLAARIPTESIDNTITVFPPIMVPPLFRPAKCLTSHVGPVYISITTLLNDILWINNILTEDLHDGKKCFIQYLPDFLT